MSHHQENGVRKDTNHRNLEEVALSNTGFWLGNDNTIHCTVLLLILAASSESSECRRLRNCGKNVQTGEIQINSWNTVDFSSSFKDFFKDFIYLFIYLFLDRGERRQKEKRQYMVASQAPPTGDLAHNPGMCPEWESNW